MKTQIRTLFFVSLAGAILLIGFAGNSFAQMGTTHQPGFDPQLMSSSFGGMSGISSGHISSGPAISSPSGAWGKPISTSPPISSPGNQTGSGGPLSSTPTMGGSNSSSHTAVTMGSGPGIDFHSKQAAEPATPSSAEGNLGSPIPQPQIHVTQ